MTTRAATTRAATTPTQAIVGSPRAARVAAARWQEWQAKVVLWMREEHFIRVPALSHEIEMKNIRDWHASWLSSLLSRGISMTALRRTALDDPRASFATLEERAACYQQRIQRRHQCPQRKS